MNITLCTLDKTLVEYITVDDILYKKYLLYLQNIFIFNKEMHTFINYTNGPILLFY
jgi:hypothetical protein